MKMIKKGEKGAATIELAFILPLMIVLLFGIIEFSLMLYNKAIITSASREGARAAVVFAYDPKNLADENDDRYHPYIFQIKQEAYDYAKKYLITFGSDKLELDDITVTPDDGAAHDELTIEVKYKYNFLVLPDFAAIPFGGVKMDVKTVMRFE